MPDLGALVYPLAFALAAASAGGLAGLLLRAGGRRAEPELHEAGWAVLLPPLAVLLLPAMSLLPVAHLLTIAPLHDLWHRWELAVHSSPAAHGLLHAANWLLLALAAACVARTVYLAAGMRAFAAELASAAARWEQAPGGPVYTLPSARPLCFTVAALRPAVYVTTALREQLSPGELAAVLAHERAHVARRDGLLHACLSLFYALFPVPGGRALLAEWERAVERRCDALAAARVGNPCDVAAVLVRVAGLGRGVPAAVPAGPCFNREGEDVEGRVRALLTLPGPEAGRGVSPLALGASLGVLLSTGLWLHHVVALFAHH